MQPVKPSRSTTVHAAFWAVVLFQDIVLGPSSEGLLPPLVMLIRLAMYAPLVAVAYGHLFVALPLLRTGRPAAYALATAALVASATVLQAVAATWPPPLEFPEAAPWALAQGALGCVYFGAVVYAIDSALRTSRAERYARESHLARLRAQLHPHVLFNTLSGLYTLAVERDPALPDHLLRHADLLRYPLYEADGPSAPLARDVEFTRNYVALSRLRLEADADVRFRADGDLGAWTVPPLLFVPLVENAFKHIDRREAYVDVALAVSAGGRLEIRVENTVGAGLSVPSGEPGGLGLRNVRERLALLFPGRHGIRAGRSGADDGRFVAEAWVDLAPGWGAERSAGPVRTAASQVPT